MSWERILEKDTLKVVEWLSALLPSSWCWTLLASHFVFVSVLTIRVEPGESTLVVQVLVIYFGCEMANDSLMFDVWNTVVRNLHCSKMMTEPMPMPTFGKRPKLCHITWLWLRNRCIRPIPCLYPQGIKNKDRHWFYRPTDFIGYNDSIG